MLKRLLYWVLTMQKSHVEVVREVSEDILERVHRLEMQQRRLTERLDDLEGRHASLSAQYRGRLGGRPSKSQSASNGSMHVMPLGAQFPPQE